MRLVVSVESTLRCLRCPMCGFKCHRVHDRRAKQIRDLEVSGRRTTLVWSRQRVVSDNCDSRCLEDHCAFEGGLTAQRRPASATSAPPLDVTLDPARLDPYDGSLQTPARRGFFSSIRYDRRDTTAGATGLLYACNRKGS